MINKSLTLAETNPILTETVTDVKTTATSNEMEKSKFAWTYLILTFLMINISNVSSYDRIVHLYNISREIFWQIHARAMIMILIYHKLIVPKQAPSALHIQVMLNSCTGNL